MQRTGRLPPIAIAGVALLATFYLIQAVSNNPQDALKQGQALSRQGEYTKALPYFDRTISLDPQNGQAFHDRGVCYHKLNQYDKAIWDYTIAIGINQQDAASYFNRGEAYSQLKQYQLASEDTAQAHRLDPNC